jgi:hypothetical protein
MAAQYASPTSPSFTVEKQGYNYGEVRANTDEEARINRAVALDQVRTSLTGLPQIILAQSGPQPRLFEHATRKQC